MRLVKVYKPKVISELVKRVLSFIMDFYYLCLLETFGFLKSVKFLIHQRALVIG